jgi:hypothetical protein
MGVSQARENEILAKGIELALNDANLRSGLVNAMRASQKPRRLRNVDSPAPKL